MGFKTSYDQDCDEFAKDGYWPIVFFTTIIQFGLQIWGSIVVFGSVSIWQYNDKSSNYFCKKAPFHSAIVFLIIEWVLLGSMVWKICRQWGARMTQLTLGLTKCLWMEIKKKYCESTNSDRNEPNDVQIPLMDANNFNGTDSEDEIELMPSNFDKIPFFFNI